MLLENGSTGPYVKCLEYDLHILNCYTGEFDGEFGPGVEAAVKQFQGRAGLSQDGVVGDGTWGKICADMKQIQFALDAFGYELQTDGEGGPNTLGAVKVFQESKGLSPDGYVGPSTQAALGISLYGGSSESGSTASGNDNFPLKVGSAGAYVKCLEYSLHIANCYTGEFDGEFGPGVKAAVEQFQTRAGIGVDGIVGPQTWSTLKGVISNIQNALNSHGASVSVDGEGGPDTLQAVENFQSSHGLGADGYVGPQTASALGIQYYGTSGGSTSGGSISSGYSAIVKYVQKVLNMIYGENLTEDGFEGANTEAAIKRFQRSKGLGQDGVIGSATMTALSEAQAESFGCNGGTVSDFVKLARKQVEIGFLEKGGSAAGTGNNDTPYGMWYGENFEPWCAMFVSWCANFSGFSEVPRYAYCPYGVDQYQNEGRFHYTGGYTPQYGDVVFYEDQGAGESTHTGIVIGYNAERNEITTIEGNAADNVAEWTRSLDQGVHLRVLGFGDNGGGSASNNESNEEQIEKEILNTFNKIWNTEIGMNVFNEPIEICDISAFNVTLEAVVAINPNPSKEIILNANGTMSFSQSVGPIMFDPSVIRKGLNLFAVQSAFQSLSVELYQNGAVKIYVGVPNINPFTIKFDFYIEKDGVQVDFGVTVTLGKDNGDRPTNLPNVELVSYFTGLTTIISKAQTVNDSSEHGADLEDIYMEIISVLTNIKNYASSLEEEASPYIEDFMAIMESL